MCATERRIVTHDGCRPPPPSPPQDKDKHLAANMARFAFCKEDASLVEAGRRLLGLKKPAS